MNFIVAVSSYLVNYRLIRFENSADALISWINIYFSQVVLTELILGISGILYLPNVIFLNLAVLAAVWMVSRNRVSSFNFKQTKGAILELLDNKVILFSVAVMVGFALVKVFVNFINPPVGWDSLNYHFTFPVEWLKHANLDVPITISDDPSPSYYPINGSLLFLWLIFPFKSVFLADMSQLPFFVMAFLAVYNISRRLNLSREIAFYGAMLFFITPNFFKQLAIAYVDVMVAALFLAGLNFLLKFSRKLQMKDCLLWSISFGLFMGTKTSGIVFGVFPFLFFVFILLKNARRLNLRKLLIFAFIFILFTGALGGFSYVRNFIQTKDPLYPADIKICGKHIVKGVMPFSTYRNRWTKEEFNLEKLLFHEGMGAQFLLLVLPATFLCFLLYIFRRRGKAMDPDIIFMLTLPLFLYFSFWNMMPQLWVRYLYPFLGVGFVAAMYFLSLLNLPLKFIRIIFVMCILGSIGELARHAELIWSSILSVLAFISLRRILRVRFNRRHALVAVILLCALTYFVYIDYDNHEFSRYLIKSRFPQAEKESWLWINNNVHDCRIAYVGRPDVLPLYGSGFKNDVIYVSVNKVHPAKLHYFPQGRYVWTKDFITLHKNLEKPGNYRENADYNDWLANLNKENIDYLLIYSLHQVKAKVFPIENTWASAHPEKFTLAFKNKEVHIYKIIK
jgi:hypothetical protein